MKYTKKELLGRAKYIEFTLVAKYGLSGTRTIVKEMNRLLKQDRRKRKHE